jgi:hypothetical protein
VRSIGWVLIVAQLVGLLWWSTVLVDRASMSWDYAIYYQAWYEIAHGHLLPATTVMPWTGPYWQSNGEFIMYVLAPLYWLFPDHLLGFWWLQDLAYFGIAAVCYRWVGELLPWRTDQSSRLHAVAAVGWLLAASLLVFNPWTYWSASFAVQMEPFGVLFGICALRALTQRRKSLWAWCVLTALCGGTSVVYVVSVGLAGFATCLYRRYANRHARVATDTSLVRSLAVPVAVGVFGVAWLAVLGAVHGTRVVSSPLGNVYQGLEYLLGSGAHSSGALAVLDLVAHAVVHLATVARVVASHGLNLWANTAPVGLVGLLSSAGFCMAVPTLLENSLLKNQAFSYPGFPSLIAYAALSVGTAVIVAAVLRRRQILGLVLVAAVFANVLIWFAVWFPDTSSQFVRVDARAAAVVASAARQVPPGAEVVASQGFVGTFAGRQYVYVFGSPLLVRNFRGPEVFPVEAPEVWFVLSAREGIEVPSTSETDQAIGSVAKLPGSSLVESADGVWVFRWDPPRGVRSVSLGGPSLPVPAWTTAGVAARLVLVGSPETWTVQSTGAEGYVASGDIWRLMPGRYVATVELSSTVPVNVEVWDDRADNDLLLARRVVSSKRVTQISLPFHIATLKPPASDEGPAIFRYEPVPPPPGESIEIRIWSPGGGTVSLRQLAIASATSR